MCGYIPDCLCAPMETLVPVQERGLTVIVEPAVLMEGTVRDSDAYSNTRGQLISWEDGIKGARDDIIIELQNNIIIVLFWSCPGLL